MTWDEIAPALDMPALHHTRWSIKASTRSTAERRRMVANLPVLACFTSGTSAAPQRWSRSGEQLLAEVDVTLAVLPPDIDAVYTCVPPDSLYGSIAMLLGVVRGLPVVHDRWALGSLPITGRRPLVVTIPIAWRWLPPTLSRCAGNAVIVHAGASMPASAAAALAGTATDDAFELFGASECGLIATRPAQTGPSQAPWTVLPDVQLVHGPDSHEQRIRIRSPRIARGPDGLLREVCTLGDWVRVLDERRFEFQGRRDRLVKVRGKAVDLDQFEHLLHGVFPHIDMVCVPVVDDGWGEHFEVYVAADQNTADSVHATLREMRGRLPAAPRRVVAVHRIDRSSMGKTRVLQTR